MLPSFLDPYPAFWSLHSCSLWRSLLFAILGLPFLFSFYLPFSYNFYRFVNTYCPKYNNYKILKERYYLLYVLKSLPMIKALNMVSHLWTSFDTVPVHNMMFGYTLDTTSERNILIFTYKNRCISIGNIIKFLTSL